MIDINDIKAGRLSEGQKILINIFEQMNGDNGIYAINRNGVNIDIVDDNCTVMLYKRGSFNFNFYTSIKYYEFNISDVINVFKMYGLPLGLYLKNNELKPLIETDIIEKCKIIDIFERFING